MDKENLTSRYDKYSSEKLIEIINSDKEVYREEAVTVAKEILFGRGFADKFEEVLENELDLLPNEELTSIVESKEGFYSRKKVKASARVLQKRGFEVFLPAYLQRFHDQKSTKNEIKKIPLGPDMKSYVMDIIDRNQANYILGPIVSLIGGIMLIYMGAQVPNNGEIGLVIGGILVLFSIWRFVSISNNIKSEEWINTFEEYPSKVIWAKPINVKHKVGLVLPIGEENFIEIWTSDRKKLIFEFNNSDEVLKFYQLANTCFPDAQLGYSSEIEEIFVMNTDIFIEVLKKLNLYYSISEYFMKKIQ